MPRGIPIKIGRREFKSATAATDYFLKQRDAVNALGLLREGPLFDELRELYLRYCESTNYDLGNREIYAFSVEYETRHTDGIYGTHLCYWVHYSPKSKQAFSVRKAPPAIAKAERLAGRS